MIILIARTYQIGNNLSIHGRFTTAYITDFEGTGRYPFIEFDYYIDGLLFEGNQNIACFRNQSNGLLHNKYLLLYNPNNTQEYQIINIAIDDPITDSQLDNIYNIDSLKNQGFLNCSTYF